ncbi:MAG: hypothetical protein QM692_18785 [Thermomicrobiales bacterium]
MDRQTFDALMLRVARQTTRRGALAAIVGGVLLGQDALTSEAGNQQQRRRKRKQQRRKKQRQQQALLGQQQTCGAAGPCAAGQTCVCVCPPGEACTGNTLKCPGNGIEVCLDTFGCDSSRDYCGTRTPFDASCPGKPGGVCINLGPNGDQPVCVSGDHGLAVCIETRARSCQDCAGLGYSQCARIASRDHGGCCYGEAKQARICFNPPA